jgi:putative ABC transport system ATP-binding protein
VSLLVAEDVSKWYASGDGRVTALDGVTLSMAAGEFVAVVGPSGCGKSTLLHLCGAMDRPSRGQVLLDGTALGPLDDDELTRLRRVRVGFVFQFFNLLPTLTLVENVALPKLLGGEHSATALAEAERLARRVGVGHRLGHYPRQLSGGEMQRAAIARALVHEPSLVIADEPTGNLDSVNGANILDLLRAVNREAGVALLLATHAAEVAAAADRVVHLRDGRVDRLALGVGEAEARRGAV